MLLYKVTQSLPVSILSHKLEHNHHLPFQVAGSEIQFNSDILLEVNVK